MIYLGLFFMKSNVLKCYHHLPASQILCCLHITVANSFTKDWPRSRSKLFDTLMVFLKDFLKKLIVKKISRQQSHANYPACKELNFDTFRVSPCLYNYLDPIQFFCPQVSVRINIFFQIFLLLRSRFAQRNLI